MSEHLLRIDTTKEDSRRKEDIIQIRIGSEEILKVNFSNLVIQSKYIRNTYKYSEALTNIDIEIARLKEKNHIQEASMKHLILYIQEGKVTIPIGEYRDIYKMSEYFEIESLREKLDKIMEEELFDDFNFSIQTLIDSRAENEEEETNLTVKLENFLSSRIDEIISMPKFWEIPSSSIYRIIEKSDKKSLNINVLVEHILDSVESRFILFKFVELDKLSSSSLDKLFQFFDDDEKSSKEMYLEYMTLNFSFIKEMKKKYDDLLDVNNKTKEELNQTKEKLSNTEEELNQTKEKLSNTEEELIQTKEKLSNTEEELNQTKKKLSNTEEELNQTKEKIDKTKDELNQTKKELEQAKEEIRKNEISPEEPIERKYEDEQYAKSIIVAGDDSHFQINKSPNNKDKNIIHPPLKLNIEPSSLLSYSSYYLHSVLITRSGSLQAAGYNGDGRITSSLQKTDINKFTEISMQDKNGQKLVPVSSVCCGWSTLFMFSRSRGKEMQLVLCDFDINKGEPVFLDIRNKQPLSLFGGCYHSAAISKEGEVIFINHDFVKKSPESQISSSSLPDGEKAACVACCYDDVIVLSSSGHVFSSKIEFGSCVLKFSRVEELSGKEIVCVSGTKEHCLAVSKEGHVFGRGSNKDGQLGLGEETRSVSKFTEISSLFDYEIGSAYPGGLHSLFETREGKILSCGDNRYGQLLLSSGPRSKVYLPKETTITSGAKFCIAGLDLSSVFIGGDPPPNTPNKHVNFIKH